MSISLPGLRGTLCADLESVIDCTNNTQCAYLEQLTVRVLGKSDLVFSRSLVEKSYLALGFPEKKNMCKSFVKPELLSF